MPICLSSLAGSLSNVYSTIENANTCEGYNNLMLEKSEQEQEQASQAQPTQEHAQQAPTKNQSQGQGQGQGQPIN